MKKKTWWLCSLLLMTVTVIATEPLSLLKSERDASFSFGELAFTPAIIFGEEWTLAQIAKPDDIVDGASKEGQSRRQGNNQLVIAGKDGGKLRWKLDEVEEGSCVDIMLDFDIQTEAKITHRYLNMSVPASLATTFDAMQTNGEVVSAAFEGTSWRQTKNVNRLRVSLNNGIIYDITTEDSVFLTIQDDRRWDKNAGFSVRYEVPADFQSYTLHIRRMLPQTWPVDISAAANRTFADEQAGDKQGGWTDQGPGNDMSVFTETDVSYRGIPFEIIDEKSTGFDSVIVIAGKKRDMAPASIDLPLPAGMNATGISLLHASGWVETNTIGEMVVTYESGNTQIIPVVGGKDVANWWVGGDLPNGKIAWSDRNDVRTVGLYASSFALSEPRPVSIEFRIVHPEAIWMIAGVTLSERPMLLPAHVPQPFFCHEDKDWRLLKFDRTIIPGSPMDFSSIAIDHKPAGKFGHVIVGQDGKLTFENAPERRLKLLGVNLCDDAQYLKKEDAEALADYLVRQGINSVRFHHHDNWLVDENSENSTTIDSARLDRLEYLIAQLKERGIYMTYDIYVSRKIKPGDNLQAYKEDPDYINTGHTGMKNAIYFYDDAFENWKTFARNWLGHVNPYTGCTLAQDPAVAVINLINEDTVGNGWNHTPGTPIQKMFARQYAAYCAKHPEVDPAYGPGNPDFLNFIYETAKARTEQMRDFLRNELGATAPLTSSNNGGDLASTWLRDCYDVVDDHIYSNHPQFPETSWAYPLVSSQSSVIAGHAWCPLNLFRGRIYGKPFIMTEVDYSWPNIYRGEEGIIMGAYCALNDIDGWYHFNFAGSSYRMTYQALCIAVFESCQDLVKQLGDRMAAAMFLRGDVAPSPVKVGYTIPRDLFKKYRNFGYPKLKTSGLVNQIGVVFEDKPQADVQDHNSIENLQAKALFNAYEKDNVADSITGQIHIDPSKILMRVVTDRTWAVAIEKDGCVDGPLAISNPNCFQILAAISMNEEPVSSSKSVILLHSTDIACTGTKFADIDRRRVEENKAGELLLRRGVATVSMKVDGPRRVQYVDFRGELKGDVPAIWENDRLTFTMDNCAVPGGLAGVYITEK